MYPNKQTCGLYEFAARPVQLVSARQLGCGGGSLLKQAPGMMGVFEYTLVKYTLVNSFGNILFLIKGFREKRLANETAKT